MKKDDIDNIKKIENEGLQIQYKDFKITISAITFDVGKSKAQGPGLIATICRYCDDNHINEGQVYGAVGVGIKDYRNF